MANAKLGVIATTAEAFRSGETTEPLPNFDFEVERQNRSPRFLEIIKDYTNKVPVKAIVEKHKCSRNTVLRYARLAGVPKRPKAFDDTIRAQVRELYKAGFSVERISNLVGVSQAYVSTLASVAGLNRYRKQDARS